MNILFYSGQSPFSNQQFGGAESSMRLMAEQLIRRNFKVFYLTKRRSLNPLPFIRYSDKGGITLLEFNSAHILSSFNPVKRLNEKSLEKEIETIIQKHNIHLVYCFYDLDILKLLLKIRDDSQNFKIIMRMAGLHWYEQCVKYPSMRKVYADVFSSVDSINFIHSDLERMVHEKIRELGMNLAIRHSFVGDIGSSVRIGRNRKYSELNNRLFNIIMAARFSSYQKRQDILVEAIALVDEKIPLNLTLIGEGPERDRIQNRIRELNLNHRIYIQPFVEQKVLWEKLESADLLCHACDYEGLGKIIIESMAVGLPVLVSNVAPLNDYIHEGENGFLTDNYPSAWAKKIEALYSDKDARIRVSDNEMTFVTEYYDPEKNISLFEKYFTSI